MINILVRFLNVTSVIFIPLNEPYITIVLLYIGIVINELVNFNTK